MQEVQCGAMVAACLAVASCMPQIVQPTRRVAGAYCLQRWTEAGERFYLVKCSEGVGPGGGGVLDGVVLRFGWNDRYLLAERRAIVRSNPDGWMLVDTRTQAITGPLSDTELQSRMKDVPELSALKVQTVKDAWQQLK